MSIGLGVAAVAALLVGGAIEVAAARRPVRPALLALPARICCLALMLAFWLGIFWRPYLALLATVVTVAVLAAISHAKRRLIGEPLVFSDFGLIRLIVRHPDLYYTDALFRPAALAGFAALVVAIGAWLVAEPALFGAWNAAGLVSGSLALVLAAWWAARRSLVANALRRALPQPDLEHHVAAWGLLLTLVGYALRWRGETARPWPSAGSKDLPAALPTAEAPFDLVVVVQLESFVDLGRRNGTPAMPGWAEARTRALAHGPLAVPAHGAYTMRSEFAVLSGLSGEALGFRRFDPFLSVVSRGAPIPATMAGLLAARGWRTLFLHPFRPGFFDRERVMRRLGFERLLWERDFAARDQRGPYIGDEALARRILAEAEHLEGQAFVMAVTMENHGPWEPGRLPGLEGKAAQYEAHLAGSDRAVAILVERLARRPGRALLCLYGDHPPILPQFDVATPPETDYVVLELGRDIASKPSGSETRMSADALGRLLSRLATPITTAHGEALPP